MSKNIRTQLNNVIGKSLNGYHSRVKPTIDELHFKEQYQGRIIDCMVGEVDDNYITTPETDVSIVKLEHSKEGVVKVPTIKGKTILVDAEGNETDTPGEGCRLVSVGEDSNKIIILSINKNLVPSQKFPWGINKDGQDNPQGSNNCTDYCLVKPNTNYISSINGNMRATNVFFYDKDKKFISKSSNTTPPVSFVTPDNCYYTRHTFGLEKEEELQLEMGEVITNYVPHQSHKTEILLNEPLRGLPNGVCDEIVGNKLIKRVGVKLLDGSGNWLNATGYPTLAYLNVSNIGNAKIYVQPNVVPNILCDELKVVSYSMAQKMGDTEMCITNRGNNTSHSVAINMPYSQNNNGEKVRKWLQGNPVTVYYELAEPIIEELPNGITLQGFDDTTMYVENSITPIVTYGYNALIPYKEELLNQKDEVEINTLDIENNIIPYLMDMEFNLMLMEDN